MKRLIIICSLMATVVTLSIVECVISTRIFEYMREEIKVVERQIDENEYSLENSVAFTHATKLLNEWKEYRNYVMTTTNHSVARNLDEKLEAMLSSIETGEFVNSKEYASLSLALIEDLIDETHPNIVNLL